MKHVKITYEDEDYTQIRVAAAYHDMPVNNFVAVAALEKAMETVEAKRATLKTEPE